MRSTVGGSRQRLTLFATLATALGAAAPARAQPPGDVALAESLFQEGKKLVEAGSYAKACPKLAESERLDPATGTLLALALCHEGEGKLATAWSEFTEVASASKKASRGDRVKLAREHLAGIEPLLSRLTITVRPETGELQGLEVKLDGIAIGRGAWGTAAPIDPGEHTVEATASGHKPWKTTVTFGNRPKTQAVTVELASEATAATSAPAPTPPASTAQPLQKVERRTAGFIVGSGGVVAMGIGAYLGLHALSQNADAKELCNPSACTSSEALSMNGDARTSANIGVVIIGVGLLAVAVGVYLVLTTPSVRAQAFRTPPALHF